MGFDNECILNIQSLAGEYFCPVCRTLVYPNEALQAQCTHLYCKPCLTYVVGTTRACPYDGYLVTEADSKPLMESNKALAETIDKIVVRCLYHKSGCTWQGPLFECTSHCSGCAFGNSPVVCNRCGVQIVHRQVQQHAQSCSGVNPQAQQATDSVQDAATAGTATPADQSQTATQSGAPTSQAQTSQTAAAPPQQANVNPQVQAVAPAVAPIQDQWYHQQYQQYPAYDPYQQPYQHYYPYQQQISQHPPNVQGQHQPQVYTQPQAHLQQPLPQPLAQPQPQPQPQPHQPQPQLHSQPQLQMPPHGQSQPHLYSQAPLAGGHQGQTQVYPQQINLAVQPHAQVQLQAHTPSHGHLPPPPQPHPQAQPHPQPHSLQPHPQHMQTPQYHQPHSHMQHLQLQNQLQPNSQAQLQLQPQPHLQGQPQTQFQNQPQPHTQPNPPQLSDAPIPNAQPLSQQPSAPAVTGHHSYPQLQSHQQMHPGATQQQSVPVHPFGASLPPAQMHGQFPQPPPQMFPPQTHASMPNQQPALWGSQVQVPSNPAGQHQQINPHQQPGHMIHQRPVMQQQINPQQYVQQPFPGQTSGLVQSHQHGQFAQQQPMRSRAHPQAPPHSMQQNPLPHLQPQQSVALAHGMHPQHSQNYAGRPVMVNYAQQGQPLLQSHGAFGGAALVRPMQVISNQPSGHQNYEERNNNQLQASSEQQFVSERGVVEQEAGSTSHKIAEEDAKGPGAASPDVNAKALKSETGMKVIDDEHKPINEGEDNSIQDETLEMNADFEVHVAKDGSNEPVIKKTVKEEGNDRALSSLPGGKSVETEAVQGKDAIDITLKQDEHPVDNSSVRQVEPLEANKAKLPKDVMGVSVQASTGTERGSQTVPPVFASNADISLHNVIPQGNSQIPRISGDSSQRGYQVTCQGLGFDKSGGFQGNGSAHHSHRDLVNDQGRNQLPSMPYGPSTHQQRPLVSMLHSGPPPGPPSNVQVPRYPPNLLRTQRPGHLPQRGPPLNPTEHFQPPILKQPGSFHPDIPHGGVPGPGSTLSLGRGPEHFGHPHRISDLQSAPQGQYNQGHVALSDAGFSKTSQGETLGGTPLGALPPPPGSFPPGGIVGKVPSHGPEGQIRRECPINPLESELFPNQRPWHVDGRHTNYHAPGSLERDPFGQSFGIESNAIRTNEAAGLDPSGLGLRDERFKTITEERLNPFPMGPTCHGEFEDGLKKFPRPSHMGMEASSKVGSYFSSRPVDRGPDGFGMDEAARRLDKLPHGFHHVSGLEMDRYGGAPSRFLPSHRSGASFHPNDDGDRELTIGLHEDNSGRDSSRTHPDILGPVPLFGRHHMERWASRSPGREHLDIPPRGFGGELDGPRNLRRGEHVRSGELGAGPGSFPNNVPLGESLGNKSSHPRLGEPGFRSSYLIQGFPNDDGIYAGDYNSFDKLRKRKPTSAGWCRICKVDCETVEGLDVHSQTREHQKMAMDMVISIKKRNAKKHKRSRSAGFKARDTKA